MNRPDFTVEKLHYDDTRVGEKTEKQFAADKPPDQQQSWQGDKEAMSEAFSVALAGAEDLRVSPVAKGEAAVIRPIVTFIEPGYYVGVSARSTNVELTVQILDAKGVVQDEITMHSTIGAGMMNPASGHRLRQAGEDLGRVTAKYLRTRVSP